MIPGVNPRQLKAMMRQMGMSQEDLDATQVIIKTPTKEYIFSNPQVQKIVMQGQTTFQLMGDYVEQEASVEVSINEDDIEMVSSQAGVSKEEAKEALEKNNGDIAQAIVSLTQ
jgi:nascent polypeptide-associated complex subunit alpha